jgi:hypothetical protein
MPLIETTGTLVPFFLREMGWDMKVGMINALYFEARRKVEVIRWKFPASENVDLRLGIDGRAIGETIYGHPVLLKQDWISTVGEAARCFIGIKTIVAPTI